MSESHDLWEDARAKTRAQVQEAFAARSQVCPACGVASETSAALCPHCRSPFTVREKGFKLTRKRIGIVVAVVAALGAGAALIVPGLQDDAATERRAAAVAQARADAAETARLQLDIRPVSAAGPARRPGEAPLAHRVRLVTAGEAAVFADARRRVAAGTMDGPVADVRCTPYPHTDARRALEADTTVAKGRYECYAVERTFELSDLNGQARTGLVGIPYWLVVDYRTADMAFCKITPRAGEAGLRVNGVVVPEACRDPLR